MANVVPVIAAVQAFAAMGAAQADRAVHWQHPAGIVTKETIAEVKAKIKAHEWARRTYDKRKRQRRFAGRIE